MSRLLNEGVYPRLCEWLHITTDGAAWGLYIGFFFLCIVVPYLLGSLNPAIILSRTVYRDDIRLHGSKNAGTTNMLRTYGARAALFTLLGDAVKTALAILFSWLMLGAGWVGAGFALNPSCYIAALFCILGHIYPIYHRMKGGKGVLCTAVAIGMLSPWVLLIEVVIFAATVAITKYVSLGSLLGAVTYPIFYASLIRALFHATAPATVTLLTFAMGLLLVYTHRSNISRLRNHEEHRISFRRKKTDATADADTAEDARKALSDDEAEDACKALSDDEEDKQ